MDRPNFVIFAPEKDGQMVFIFWQASMNSATDTIMSTGPAEVAMRGMTYWITARVAPEDLHASCVMFSKNLLYFLLFGDISLWYSMVAGVGNLTVIPALFVILGLEKNSRSV